MTTRTLLSRFRSDDQAIMMVELALVMPILLLLLLVGVELTRFMIINQKVERASATIADLVSQTTVMTENGLQSLFAATNEIFEPFELGGNGTIIVSSIGAAGGPATIDWQRFFGGGTDGSYFGEQAKIATLPPGLTVTGDEHLIACEVFYRYQPMMFQDVLPADSLLYRYAVFRPRFGTLDVILP